MTARVATNAHPLHAPGAGEFAAAFTKAAGDWARTRIYAAIRLLTWLGDQGLTLATARQQHIDTWLVTGSRDTTYPAREFLHWARQRHLTTVAISNRQPLTSLAPITEGQRWEQLRRCLHDASLPTQVRAAGALGLLCGLPVSRITALRHDDLEVDTGPTGRTWLRYGDHRLRLPPAVAVMLVNQRDHASTASVIGRSHPDKHTWLFPGGFPGQPTRHGLYRALREHLDIHLRRARSAALASLAAELPARRRVSWR